MNVVERYIEAAHVTGCPRDRIDRFMQAGVVLQPRQLEASAIARQMDVPGGPTQLGYGGARGGGKSHWMLAQMAVDDCQRYPDLKCLLLRKVGKAAKESFDDLRPKVLSRVPHNYSRSRGTLTFPNGSRIIIGNFKDERDVDKYLGLEYDVIGVEEATTLSNSKYQMIQTCNRTSKADWRPRMYTTTNPGNIGHAWYKKLFVDPFRRGERGDTRFVPATIDDNAFINADYDRVLSGLTGWMLRAWRYGDWDIAAGQFFTPWSRDKHVKTLPVLPEAWRTWCAMDYGFTHYTVVYLMAEDGDGNIYIVNEHAERRWLVPRHAEAIKAMLARHRTGLHRLEAFVAGADVFAQRGTGATIAEQYKAAGITLRRADMDRVNGAAEWLKRLGDSDAASPGADIPPSVFISRLCPRLIECLPLLQHDPNRPEDVLKWDTDENGDGGDDPYDAARYGLMWPGQRPKPSKVRSYSFGLR